MKLITLKITEAEAFSLYNIIAKSKYKLGTHEAETGVNVINQLSPYLDAICQRDEEIENGTHIKPCKLLPLKDKH